MKLDSVLKRQYNFSVESLSRSSTESSNSTSLNQMSLLSSASTPSTAILTSPISLNSLTDSDDTEQFNFDFSKDSINQENLSPNSINNLKLKNDNIMLHENCKNVTTESCNLLQNASTVRNKSNNLILKINKINLTPHKVIDNRRVPPMKIKIINNDTLKVKKLRTPLPITKYFPTILSKESSQLTKESKNKFFESSLFKKMYTLSDLVKNFKSRLAKKTNNKVNESKKSESKLSNSKFSKKNFCLKRKKDDSKLQSTLFNELNKNALEFNIQNNCDNENILLNKDCDSNEKSSNVKMPSIINSNWRPINEGYYQYVKTDDDVKPVRRLCFDEIHHYIEHKEIIRIHSCVKIYSAEGSENIGKVLNIFYDETNS